MESYSPFFQTLHDERSPTGHLGDGTHASILRAIVFKDANLRELNRGAEHDFAIVWDADHDTRVIKAVEAIYREGLLSSILMIGERKGTLHAVVLGQNLHDYGVKSLHGYLEKELHGIAQSIEGDPWLPSLRTLANPDRLIIDDDDDKVRLYLANLKMLWRLGVRASIDHYLRFKTARSGKLRSIDLVNRDTAAIVKSFPNIPELLDAAEFEALWEKAWKQALEGPKKDEPNSEETPAAPPKKLSLSEQLQHLKSKQAAAAADLSSPTSKIRLVESKA
jgi:hypothetical protein